MSLVNCPECGREISDKAKQCVHCGCPINKMQQKIGHKQVLWPILSGVCLLLCIIFLILFLFTTNDTRTVFFQNNKYYLTAVREIGAGEKREKVNEFTYHHRLNSDDDIVLEIIDNDNGFSFLYYLSNAEIRIEFSENYNTCITYSMTKDGILISNNSSPYETTVEVAASFRGLLNSIVNFDLNGSCTIDNILLEYYDYCNLIKTIKITGIIFASIFFVGFGGCLVLSIMKFRSKH